MKNEVTDNSERSSSVSAGSLRVVVPRRRAPADGETTVRIACSQEVHCMVTGPWSSGCFRAGNPPTPRRSRGVTVRSYRRRTTGFHDIVGKHSKPTAACPACAARVVRTPTAERSQETSRGDARDIWTAATGVAAFQNAAISPRVLNRKSLAGTSRFEKRWFRPPHSKCFTRRCTRHLDCGNRSCRFSKRCDFTASFESQVTCWHEPF